MICRKEPQSAQRGQTAIKHELAAKERIERRAGKPQPKVVKLRSARSENSPPLQRWVMARENKASPVRDERSVVPDGTYMACLAGVPSHKWLGYFHEIFAKMGDSDGLQYKERKEGVFLCALCVLCG
jgi:hypothetical protein